MDNGEIVINEAVAKKVLTVVDAGLSKGMGSNRPGRMCVEAAVCFALGWPHGDNPKCVDSSVRVIKIALNDQKWSSSKVRAAGLRRIAIAQLGTKSAEYGLFDNEALCELFHAALRRRIMPNLLMFRAGVCKDEVYKKAMLRMARDLKRKDFKLHSDNFYEWCRSGPSGIISIIKHMVGLYTIDSLGRVDCDLAEVETIITEIIESYDDGKVKGGEKVGVVRDRALAEIAEELTRVLAAMKTPGSRFLYLTEKP